VERRKASAPRKQMFAATRNIRGARRIGRGFGCSHSKRRCGLLDNAPIGAPPPLIFLEAAFVQWLGKARAQKRAARTGIAWPPTLSAQAENKGLAAILPPFARLVAGSSLQGPGKRVFSRAISVRDGDPADQAF
jgi:hypothetical protein